MSIGIHAFVSDPSHPLVCGYCGREEHNETYHGSATKGVEGGMGAEQPSMSTGDAAALHETIATLRAEVISLRRQFVEAIAGEATERAARERERHQEAIEKLKELGLPIRERDELWSAWQYRVKLHRDAIALLEPAPVATGESK